MKKIYRVIVYICGLIVLALGVILSTKTDLGVSPIVSIPYCISKIWNIDLGDITACIYILYVVGQIVVLKKRFRPLQLLQIPVTVFFSQIINLFNSIISISSNNLVINSSLLFFGILFTGLGASMTILTNILPISPDGFVQAVSEKTGIKLGLVKNILDASCVIITLIIGYVFAMKIVGIGVGTLLAVIGVGRTVFLVDLLFKNKIQALVS